ncbi:MAG: chalcone isomerase [Smithella sp. SDB]|nr:MAG: chalcone isomerase [Smithella sp. SDB]
MKKLLITLLLTLALVLPSYAITSNGIDFQDTLKAGQTNLIFNGSGIRTKAFLNIYVAALYLTKKQSNYITIMNADEPMAIRIVIISRLVSSGTFIEATKAGFERTTNGNTAPIKAKIDMLCEAFKDKIKKGDVFDLIYVPDEGTSIYRNGTLKSTIEGLDFKKYLFGIWIIDKPSHGNEPLRKGMLGLQ